MSRAIAEPARSALPALAAALLILPSPAQAGPAFLHELPAVSPAAGPLRVAGSAPAPRFRASGARASSVLVDDASAEGTRTNGKILATDPRSGRYSCSGTALNTPSGSIVLTAGHCVTEHGSVGRRMSFIPAYDHGSRPFGTFKVEALYVMPQWRRRGNPDFDVAALRVRANKLGRLTDVVGARGYVTSLSRRSVFEIFGYPAARARGEELRSCRAHGLGIDRLTRRLAGPPTMPASCDMAAGSSGGGWLFDGQYLSGVTSYSYQGRSTQLFSPYFGPAVGSFLGQLP